MIWLWFIQFFHWHRFSPWTDEKESRLRSLWTPMYGATRESVWYQRRQCVKPFCRYAQIRRLEKK